MLIARRVLEVIDESKAVVESLVLEVDAPVQKGEDWEWFTPVRLLNHQNGAAFEEFEIFGVDQFASLAAALVTASIRIHRYQERYRSQGLQLTWMGDESLGLLDLVRIEKQQRARQPDVHTDS